MILANMNLLVARGGIGRSAEERQECQAGVGMRSEHSVTALKTFRCVSHVNRAPGNAAIECTFSNSTKR
jgi:hypothetical protein